MDDAEKTPSEKIDDIMDNFNFRKVFEYMTETNWEWGNGNGDMHLPDESELRACARSLLKIVTKDKDETAIFCSSGGFHALRYGDTFALHFSIAHWDC
tara:strand:- start:241 stop:534 length:294 start_codon:yes stop_codon:yes gene_type:complete